MESTRIFVPSKSSVKERNSFLIFLKSTPEAVSSKIIATSVTDKNRATVFKVTWAIEDLSLIVIIKPLYSPELS